MKIFPLFEKYFKIQIKLRLLGVNPEQYIDKDNRLATIKQLNNDVIALETKAVIENPRSKEDYKAKEKLEGCNELFNRYGDVHKRRSLKRI